MAKAVMWPESQDLMCFEGFDEHSELINTEKGLDKYGSSAYYVDEDWLEDVKNGKVRNLVMED